MLALSCTSSACSVLRWLLGLALAPLMSAELAFCAVIEERSLYDELTGYAEYAVHVRYRLIPFIW